MLAASLAGTGTAPAVAANTSFSPGDLFAGISEGKVSHYSAGGALLETLDTGRGGYTTGCGTDVAGNLYITNFGAGTVTRFSGPAAPHQNLGAFGSGYSGSPESIVFDAAGNVYVGAVNGDNDVRMFDGHGNFIRKFDVPIESNGSDWLDLARDQRTLFYTSEGKRILRFDVGTNTALPDFASNLPGTAFALRILPDGGVLVADSQSILRLDRNGNVVGTYDAPNEDSWFSLNLHPDGKTFWAGGYATGKMYHFNIDGGAAPIGTINTGVGANRLFGICMFGERTQALADSDGDGLLDDWEEKGFDFNHDGTVDVDLPAMGANKNHKDVFVYVDWLEGTDNHRPDDATIKKVVDAFAAAPVDNAAGGRGVNLHVVMGHKITENATTSEIGSVFADCNYNWSEFDGLKAANFPAKDVPLFHYMLFAHDLPQFPCLGNGRPSGISRNNDLNFPGGASDFLVGLAGWETYFNSQHLGADAIRTVRAATFMHELGHNLGLGHGGLQIDGADNVLGSDHTNGKPNHLSVMNYAFSSRGLLKQNDMGVLTPGLLDYSRFTSADLPDLDENALHETTGLGASAAAAGYGSYYYCNGGDTATVIARSQAGVDWNCNGGPPEAAAIATAIHNGTARTNLHTVNEWAHLRYKGGAIGAFGVAADLPTSSSMAVTKEITLEKDILIGSFAGPLQPTSLTTQASPAMLLGGPVTDAAVLAGGLNPTGTITFRLYGPDDTACARQAVSSSNVAVGTGNGRYTSASYTPTAAGTFRWVAGYSGDSANAPSSSPCNAPGESVVIRPFTPPACTRSLSGDVTGPITVGAGDTVCLLNARVAGPVTVNAGGALTVAASRITNGIVVTSPAFLSVCGSQVSAPAGNPAQGVVVTGAAVPVRIGDPANGCVANKVVGDVTMSGNTGGFTLGANAVSRNVTADNNTVGLDVLRANVLSGTLACSGNNPPPTNAGEANTAPSKTGQCAQL